MTIDVLQAIRLLASFDKHFRVWTLTGDSNSGKRQRLMEELTGERLPKSRCSINALWDEFLKHIQASGNCLASRRDDFTNRCRSIVGA